MQDFEHYLQNEIDDISAALKRPGLSFVERQLLHGDRKDLREKLARIQQEQPHE